MGTADEIASLALYLCSDDASFVTGSNFPIDGGFLNLR
jgi:2-keto-3-deoxy-L-fuconate dehydrogenase